MTTDVLFVLIQFVLWWSIGGTIFILSHQRLIKKIASDAFMKVKKRKTVSLDWGYLGLTCLVVLVVYPKMLYHLYVKK